ncbi:MAG: FAD-binding oxidoreductase [Myxococcales bacterium]|nr:MAG: FAD-binding oxidoreductase [Myxococcales bacterium]
MSERNKAAMLCGWGRVGVPGTEIASENLVKLSEHAVLSRGLGRSYGDASLPPSSGGKVIQTKLADRMLAFDEKEGWLRAEAGLCLAEVLRVFMPRGWFPAVTPGTKFVTLGGMVASDVHGKNHHVDGCIGNHVRSLKMRVADGRVLTCSREDYPDLFWATMGGMGLTGHILEVEMRLKAIPSPWIFGQSERMVDIDAYLDGLQHSAAEWPFTMGWIDCLSGGSRLGRGILMRGRWAQKDEAPKTFPTSKKKLSVPFEAPSFLMGRTVVTTFNELYFRKHIPKKKQGIVHPDSFFYPLDAIHHWNRLYGPRGFTQYQCVLPRSVGAAAARRVLEILAKYKAASFLCVIKDCGEQGQGLLSFPMPGISIALDIPIRDNTQELVDALNEQLIRDGGRIYLTKDGFTREKHFAQMESRLAHFNEIRQKWDPQKQFKSALSQRVLGDE